MKSLFACLLSVSGLVFAEEGQNAAAIKDIRDEIIDHQQALDRAVLSRTVYQLNSTYFDPVPDQYDVVAWIDQGSTEVLITTTNNTNSNNKQQVTVTFRGSEEIADWVVNFDQVQLRFGYPNHTIPYDMHIPTQDGKTTFVPITVHRGFNEVFKVYEQILEIIDPLIMVDDMTELVVTGHSLGGANAQLFASRYAFAHPQVAVWCTTFGQPRPGNLGFKMFLESIRNLNMWRLVHNNDIVPRTGSPGANYTHAGHLMWKRRGEGTNNASASGTTSAYYRQIGYRQKGFRGIQDFSVALLGSIQNDINDLLEDHYVGPTIENWLSDASQFAAEYTKFPR